MSGRDRVAAVGTDTGGGVPDAWRGFQRGLHARAQLENGGGVLIGTYKEVQEKLRAIGIVISKKGDTHRINFFGGLPETARYMTNLQDALRQGVEMAKPVRTEHDGPSKRATLL